MQLEQLVRVPALSLRFRNAHAAGLAVMRRSSAPRVENHDGGVIGIAVPEVARLRQIPKWMPIWGEAVEHHQPPTVLGRNGAAREVPETHLFHLPEQEGLPSDAIAKPSRIAFPLISSSSQAKNDRAQQINRAVSLRTIGSPSA